MQLADKKVLVVGFGKTGVSTTAFLLEKGAAVTLADRRKRLDIPREFTEGGVRVEAGEHEITTFVRQDLIVVSPGVPMASRPIIEAQARGVEVISEIELAYRFVRAPLIAVTGTNGKTTTTSLLGHMFAAAGKKVFVGGNLGTPLIEAVRGGQSYDYVIAEISSFQLEGIRSFKPDISVLLNITEDHLDRYGSFGEYAEAKSRILLNQTAGDSAVMNLDDAGVKALATKTAARPFFFSTRDSLDQGAYDNGVLHFRRDSRYMDLDVAGARLQGSHNRENMLAAASVGFLCRLPEDRIRESLVGFSGLSHRMEPVDTIDGIRFYNDSKGTNVGACVKSLESMQAPVVLIAGGKDKGGTYEPLKELVRQKVKALVLIGEAKHRIAEALGDAAPAVPAASLEEAVQKAFVRADEGDAVLLSPACSSFDMFTGYEERGDLFKKIVKTLRKNGGGAPAGVRGVKNSRYKFAFRLFS